MASTAGRKVRPLPASVTQDLATMGYFQMPFTDDGVPVFKHPEHPRLFVTAVASNIPGDTHVTARWFMQGAQRIEADELMMLLRAQIQRELTGTAMVAP